MAVLANLVAVGVDAHLLIIGEQVRSSDATNRAYLQQVQHQIESHHLSERVHWTGYLPAAGVSAAFMAADLCVLPYVDGASYRRGSLMAALAHGLPIVTTISAVSYADFVDGETLLLVPAGDAGALATAARRILDDPDLAQRLRTGARQLSQQLRGTILPLAAWKRTIG